MPSSQKPLSKPRSKPRRLNVALGAPLLLLSLAFHGVVLSLPMPGEETTQEEAPTEIGNTSEPQAVKVVKLPSAPPPKQNAQPTRSPAKAPLALQTSVAAQPLTQSQPPAPAPKPPQAAPSAPDPTPELPPESPSEPPPDSPSEPPQETPADILPAQPPPLTLAERLQDPAAYAYNNRTKSAEVGTQDFIDWYSGLSSEVYGTSPMPGSKSIEPLRIQYPLNACLATPPELGRLGVVVDAAGAVVPQPEVLASTGYDVLDEQALAAVTHYTFPPTGMVTAYGLPVQVEYDATTCVAPAK